MKEVAFPDSPRSVEATSFLACVATVLELPLERMPEPRGGDEIAGGWMISRWLGGLGLGMAAVSEPAIFSWAGPWIARVRSQNDQARYVVMYGVPSGIVWDPAGDGVLDSVRVEAGFLIAAADVALALAPHALAPTAAGSVEGIWIADAAGMPARALKVALAIAGRGLAGDRHVLGRGTFPSGLPGSALTLIEAEVCESFDPPLAASEHRRNVLTRGIELNGLVGREFRVGAVRCLGTRLCEPCSVVEGYASRPVLRALVHQGGLRADVLEDGAIHVGDPVWFEDRAGL